MTPYSVMIVLFLLGIIASKSLPSLQLEVLGEKNIQNQFLHQNLLHDKGWL